MAHFYISVYRNATRKSEYDQRGSNLEPRSLFWQGTYDCAFTEARDLLEIVESRYKRNSTIFCSQFDIPGWPEKLSDPLLADAICDRIVHDAYTVVIGGKESMRKRKGLQDA